MRIHLLLPLLGILGLGGVLGAAPPVLMLDISSCQITLTELRADKSLGECASFRIRFASAKWESRLNYRLNQLLCREIRDYDKVGIYDNATIDFLDCIEDGSEAILRIAVHDAKSACLFNRDRQAGHHSSR